MLSVFALICQHSVCFHHALGLGLLFNKPAMWILGSLLCFSCQIMGRRHPMLDLSFACVYLSVIYLSDSACDSKVYGDSAILRISSRFYTTLSSYKLLTLFVLFSSLALSPPHSQTHRLSLIRLQSALWRYGWMKVLSHRLSCTAYTHTQTFPLNSAQ